MGVLRLYLALVVFDWHYLSWGHRYEPNSFAAVIMFFMISGFYMALVLDTKYRAEPLRFYANRALRLYPVYLLGLGLAMTVHFGPFSSLTFGIGQMLIFPTVLWDTLTLSAEGASAKLWFAHCYTIGIEMMFYALAPFIVLQRTRFLLMLAAIAAGLHLLPPLLGLEPRAWQYEFFPSVLVFFLGGALAYRACLTLKMRHHPRWLGWLALPAIVGWFAWSQNHAWANEAWIYLTYALVACAIPFLFIASEKAKVDRFIGDLSYPLYVVHPIGVWIVWGTALKGTIYEKPVVFALVLIVSAALVAIVDRPLDRLRHRVARDAGRRPSPSSARPSSTPRSLSSRHQAAG